MPALALSTQQLALARHLAEEGWTHGRIAALFNAHRATVSYALKHRKTLLPTRSEELTADIMSQAVTRAHRAACRAIACELRAYAQELEAANPATS